MFDRFFASFPTHKRLFDFLIVKLFNADIKEIRKDKKRNNLTTNIDDFINLKIFNDFLEKVCRINKPIRIYLEMEKKITSAKLKYLNGVEREQIFSEIVKPTFNFETQGFSLDITVLKLTNFLWKKFFDLYNWARHPYATRDARLYGIGNCTLDDFKKEIKLWVSQYKSISSNKLCFEF